MYLEAKCLKEVAVVVEKGGYWEKWFEESVTMGDNDLDGEGFAAKYLRG